jgi:hypothetical protein
MRSKWTVVLSLGIGLAAVAACKDVPLAPKWNADLFFPIQFADVALGGTGGVAPGGIIPPVSVSDTSSIDSQDISGATKQILDEDVNSIKADVIFSNTVNLTGSIVISVSPNQFDLFSSDPSRALTVTIPVHQTAGDTLHTTANVNVFKNQNVLYSQSRTTVACGAGLCAVTSNDKLQIGVNLTANVAISQ